MAVQGKNLIYHNHTEFSSSHSFLSLLILPVRCCDPVQAPFLLILWCKWRGIEGPVLVKEIRNQSRLPVCSTPEHADSGHVIVHSLHRVSCTASYRKRATYTCKTVAQGIQRYSLRPFRNQSGTLTFLCIADVYYDLVFQWLAVELCF